MTERPPPFVQYVTFHPSLDLERTHAFYAEVLGLELIASASAVTSSEGKM